MNDDSMTGGRGAPGVGEAARVLKNDLGAFGNALSDKKSSIVDAVGRFVHERPVGAIGIAFGIGYVLGGGLFSRTTSRVMRIGMRMGGLAFARDFLSGLTAKAI